MKRLVIICISVLLTIKGYTQANEVLKDGYHIFRYPQTNTTSSEGLIKNGKPDGFWKSYYVTGIKKSEGRYTSFKLDSIWLFL